MTESAEIFEVFGTGSDGTGPIELVKYTVRHFVEFGYHDFPNVVPANVRPVAPGFWVIAARPGDPVVISWRGNEIRFIIAEGIAPTDCEGIA